MFLFRNRNYCLYLKIYSDQIERAMIIVFSSSAINHKAAEALIAKHPQSVFALNDISNHAGEALRIDPQDDTIKILDLSANGNMQNYYSPMVMAERLYDCALLDNVKTIQLLISDVVVDHSLLGYGTSLSQALITVAPECDITVCAPGDVTNCTLIEPPGEPDGKWTIFSGAYPKEKPPNKQESFQFYKARLTPSFRGDIEEVLENPAYVISAEAVRAKHDP